MHQQAAQTDYPVPLPDAVPSSDPLADLLLAVRRVLGPYRRFDYDEAAERVYDLEQAYRRLGQTKCPAMDTDPTILDQAYELGMQEGERMVLEGMEQWTRFNPWGQPHRAVIEAYHRWHKKYRDGILIRSVDGPAPRPWRTR